MKKVREVCATAVVIRSLAGGTNVSKGCESISSILEKSTNNTRNKEDNGKWTDS